MYKDILLPIDLNHESSWEKALPVAVEYCKAFGSRLHVMTVVPLLGMHWVGGYFLEDFEAKARAEANKRLHAFVRERVPEGVAVQHIVMEGTVYEEILKTADRIKADLIIMAKYRPDLKDYLLGPNAERVTRHAPQSVLIVHD